MAREPRESATEVERCFIARTKQARETFSGKQAPICRALGVLQGTYKNYEINRPLPVALIAQFCEITKIRLDWLFTGEGPMIRTQESPPPERRKATGRRKAA